MKHARLHAHAHAHASIHSFTMKTSCTCWLERDFDGLRFLLRLWARLDLFRCSPPTTKRSKGMMAHARLRASNHQQLRTCRCTHTSSRHLALLHTRARARALFALCHSSRLLLHVLGSRNGLSSKRLLVFPLPHTDLNALPFIFAFAALQT